MPPNENDFPIIDRIISRLDEAYGDLRLSGKIVGLVPGFCSARARPDHRHLVHRAKLDFVAHEAGHGLGLAHAMSGNGCSDDDGTGRSTVRCRCAADQRIGLDPRFWSGGAVGRFMPVGPEKAGVFDATPDAEPEIYDYMSYCSAEGAGGVFPGRTWVASGYWATTARELVSGGRIDTGFSGGCCFLGAAPDPTVRRSIGARRGGNGPIMHVSALLTPGPGGPDMITRAEPDKGAADPVAGGRHDRREARRRQPDLEHARGALDQRRPFGHQQRPHPRGRDLHHRRLGEGRRVRDGRRHRLRERHADRHGQLAGGEAEAAQGRLPAERHLHREVDGDRHRRRPAALAAGVQRDGGKTWRTLAVGLAGPRPG